MKEGFHLDFYIPKEELITHRHINFSVDLDDKGLLISSAPTNFALPKHSENLSADLMSDLNHLSWGELYALGLSGDARRHIALGAVKTDHMKNGFNAEYRIIGFNHDDLADGSGKAPFSWEMVRAYKDKRPMNQECTNEGGWDRCDLRKWLNSDFVSSCSDELQSVIRPVIKLGSAGGKSQKIIESVDRIFILSEKEVFGRAIYSAPGEGHWYEYYKLEDVPYFATDEDMERVIRGLRSASDDSPNFFCRVSTDGSAYTVSATYSLALLPGFCF